MRLIHFSLALTFLTLQPIPSTKLTPAEQSAPAAKPTPMILAVGDGERREFRTRPGVTFTLKVDPKNGGS